MLEEITITISKTADGTAEYLQVMSPAVSWWMIADKPPRQQKKDEQAMPRRMTNQEIIDVVAAKWAGRAIQVESLWGKEGWEDCTGEIAWNFKVYRYRVKPARAKEESDE